MNARRGWLIYGANGFTGQLVAREAKRRGLSPVLAGRSGDAVRTLGSELGLESRVFGLHAPDVIDEHLREVGLVLHCAGPFSRTHAPMLDACVRAGVHYLDITGEYAVLDATHWRGREVAAAGVVAVSGVGFDVVPTDGVAALLAAALPSAVRLRLAIMGGTISRGTAITMLEGAGKGSVRRRAGLLVREPFAQRVWHVEHDGVRRVAVGIPWGDVATAYYSTGIPDVETYSVTSAPPELVKHGARLSAPLMRLPAVRGALQRVAGRVRGPSERQMREERTVVWGEVTDRAGQRRTLKLVGPEGYRFTVLCALAAVERVLAGSVTPGAWTPSQAFGKDFVTGIAGVQVFPGASDVLTGDASG